MRNHQFNLSSVDLTAENLKNMAAVVLTTNHDDFDYDLIRKHAALIVDSRGVYREPGRAILSLRR